MSMERWSRKRPAWSIELDSGPPGTIQYEWSSGGGILTSCVGLLYGLWSACAALDHGCVVKVVEQVPATSNLMPQ